MSWRDVRPVALGVPTRGEEVLLAEHRDPAADETFYRPVGGGVEFGEYSEEAVVREFREELDATITDARLLDTFEDVFAFDGETGHEIWFCYAVELAEEWPYETDSFVGREPEFDEEFPVRWLPVADLEADDVVVYPESLPELL